jgi:hypothetical protein
MPHNDRCYEFNFDSVDIVTDWITGRQKCNDLGMELVTVDSQDEQDWLDNTLYNSGFFNDGSSLNGIWIGYIGRLFKLFLNNYFLMKMFCCPIRD